MTKQEIISSVVATVATVALLTLTGCGSAGPGGLEDAGQDAAADAAPVEDAGTDAEVDAAADAATDAAPDADADAGCLLNSGWTCACDTNGQSCNDGTLCYEHLCSPFCAETEPLCPGDWVCSTDDPLVPAICTPE